MLQVYDLVFEWVLFGWQNVIMLLFLSKINKSRLSYISNNIDYIANVQLKFIKNVIF